MRILHLSDPHFGLMTDSATGVQRSTHRFINASTQTPDPRALASILARDPEVTGIDAVVISGDIGWSGQQADYIVALEALENLRDAISAPILITPGNHDVDLQEDVKFDHRQEGFEWLVRNFYGTSLKTVYPLMDGEDSSNLTRRERLIGFLQLSDRLVVISVNSSAYQATSSTPIAVSGRALQAAQDHVAGLSLRTDALRIFALHHHLMPFAEEAWTESVRLDQVSESVDDSLVLNSARVQEWLARNSFSLVLHGHKHRHHGREDKLWTGPGRPRRVTLIGAGSCGVSTSQRQHGEPLSYNIVEASPRSRSEWRFRVIAQQVDENITPVAAAPWFSYASSAGARSYATRSFFESVRMDDCHKDIAQEIMPNVQQRNFMSVVADSTYVHPPTLRNGSKIPEPEEVERSFRSLHPEYSTTSGWNDPDHVRSALLEPRQRLEHGSRMFKATEAGRSPIDSAIIRLEARSSWAYLGLYRSDKDTEEEPSPLPGLMGIQFVPDHQQGRLHLVATFRNLELSFWWAVNMYEFGLVLDYALDRSGSRLQRGGITMYSAIAEWATDPAAVFTALLDDMGLDSLLKLAARALTSAAQEPRTRLAELLRDKEINTSRTNVELAGLRNLRQALLGASALVTESELSPVNAVIRVLSEAVRHLESADYYTDNIMLARQKLRELQALVLQLR